MVHVKRIVALSRLNVLGDHKVTAFLEKNGFSALVVMPVNVYVNPVKGASCEPLLVVYHSFTKLKLDIKLPSNPLCQIKVCLLSVLM